MQYQVRTIDQKATQIWAEKNVYKTENDFSLPKYYVLEMFPYPSGAGLHVGHPLGYVAGDILARYKRMQGFNVLHPMGFDSFGLPTEQYSIETGIHPTEATTRNIATYRKQLDKIGLSFDWSREVVTSDPNYFKWTQWIFLELFESYYCTADRKAKSIKGLIELFEKEGNQNQTAYSTHSQESFSASEWNQFSEKEKSDVLMKYRLAYVDLAEVNWCEALGTVLANDEVINGFSERGGHPVVKKQMRQWFLRISAYADRLLQNLNFIDFSTSLKEQQRNWIGKSEGAVVSFSISDSPNASKIDVFTTRPDTIFGCTFMVLAPEHPLVLEIMTEEKKSEVTAYMAYCAAKSDIDRQAEKKVTGAFTGAYAVHPFTQNLILIYISEYVLMGYGTGAIMAVPAEDERDRKFAETFGIDILDIFDKSDIADAEIGDKKGVYIHSDFLNNMTYQEGIALMLAKIESMGIGHRKTQFRLRDAGFSRQRYWGEPIPIVWKEGVAYPLSFEELPLINPEVDEILPTKDGSSPLARNQAWVHEKDEFTRETDTMPAFAGSSWYFLRYMQPDHIEAFVNKEVATYWNQVDTYIGGSEHAVGHLLYARFFNNFLFDRDYISFEEPFKKLVNQGMIQGRSNFVYRSIQNPNIFVSKNLAKDYEGGTTPLHVDVNIVENDILDIEQFKKWRQDYAQAEFVLENQQYVCGWEIEKMSKSKYNVVNPDIIIEKYGADCFRMYEMFLGPIELSKPWSSTGIEGVSKFLRRFWHLYFNEEGHSIVTTETPTTEEFKILHKCIKKINEDIEKFSYNTCVSAFMIALNELTALKCHKSDILIPLLKSITPLAPHTAEAIWSGLGEMTSIVTERFPVADESYLVENDFEYPVSINGKMRVKLNFALDMSQEEIQDIVLKHDIVIKWLEGKPLKKMIFVKGRMINLVV